MLLALDSMNRGCGTVVMLPFSDDTRATAKNLPALSRTWVHTPYELTCAKSGASWLFNANTLHWGRSNQSYDYFRILLNITFGSSVDTLITDNRSESNESDDKIASKKKRKRHNTFAGRNQTRKVNTKGFIFF